MLTEDFLESYFQFKLDEAAHFAATPAAEDRPYDNFYKAREIMKEIMEDEVMADESIEDVKAMKSVLNYQLAMNSFETDEIGATRTYLNKSLEYLIELPATRAISFFNMQQVAYNVLGLINLNSENTEVGLAYLQKAERIFEKSMEIAKALGETCSNNMDEYSRRLHLYSYPQEAREKDPKTFAMINRHPDLRPMFKFYYQGGIDVEASEKAYTLTCFYMAQAYAKQKSGKDQSAYYCGMTLKRQVDCGDYEAKEWANNSMGLSEYFKQERMYSQALYIIFTALEVLPKGRHSKTRASLRIMIANILNDQLAYNVNLIRSDAIADSDEKNIGQLVSFINKEKLKFEGVKVNFPQSKVYRNYEEIKTLFKMVMTEYKKAAEVYPLDGYVTEHINIMKQMSEAYKTLALLEADIDRKVAMELKRKEYLMPLYKNLNPKVYIGPWREVCIELAAISNSIYELRRGELFLNEKHIDFKDKKVRIKVKQMTDEGLMSIDIYEQICAFFGTEDYNDESEKEEYIQSVINARFNIAKTYNGLVPEDVKTRVQYLKKSLENYTYIRDYIRQKGGEKGSLSFNFGEQLRLCDEMCELLPTKISKINAGANI